MENDILDPAESPGETPVLYSPQVILWFSFFFSPIFGAILMSLNLKDSAGKWQCLLFGFIYTFLCLGIAQFVAPMGYLSIFTSLIGGHLLRYLFWNRYIGNNTAFTARPWVTPLLIGVGITVIYVTLMILHI